MAEEADSTTMSEYVNSEGERERTSSEEELSGSDSTDDGSEKALYPNGSISMGKKIFAAFPHPLDYEDDEAADIFDDGVEDDDSSDSESGVSVTFEELTEPDVQIITKIVHSPAREEFLNETEDESESSYAIDDEAYSTSAGYVSGANSELVDDVGKDTNTVESEPVQHPPAKKKKNFNKLQKLPYKVLYNQPNHGIPTESLEESCDAIRWELLDLEETKKQVEERIATLQQSLEVAQERQEAAGKELEAKFLYSGISPALFDAYQEFCESLEPEYGQRGGFSIACTQPHKGSYTSYDPDFVLFKESIEGPYHSSNFRCEASTLFTENIVEFWPLKSPEPALPEIRTWCDQYAELYDLAEKAVLSGSQAATELLACIPKKDSILTRGGLLFEYIKEPALARHPIISRRWRFKSTHEIDSPRPNKQNMNRIEDELLPRE